MEAPTKGIVSWWSPDLAGGGEAAADVPECGLRWVKTGAATWLHASQWLGAV